MVRFLKWFFPIITAALLAVVAGAYWYATPQRLKAFVQPRLSSALGKEVMFDHIAWRRSDGVVISGFSVKDRVGDRAFLIAEHVHVQVSPIAWLLGKRWWGELVLKEAVVSPMQNRAQGRDVAIVFRHLKMDLSPPEDGRLSISQIEGQVCEGTVEGALVWDRGAWDGALSLVNAQAEQIVHSAGWDIPLFGAVDITVQVSGASVKGTANMAEGRIVKWDFLQRLLHPMAQWGLIHTDEVPLKDVAVVFQVQGDEVILDGTKFTAAAIVCALNGKHTRKGQLDYVLDVEMPIQFAGFRLGSATIPIQIKIKGTTNAPKVTVTMK